MTAGLRPSPTRAGPPPAWTAALGTSADRAGVEGRKGMKEKAETDVWVLDGSETNERNNGAGALPNV